MTGEGERLSRAGSYVLGLMNASDRERAERDLERDPAFRDAVLKIAERMRVLDVIPEKALEPAERWRAVAAHIRTMPQMRRVGEALPAIAPAAGAPSRRRALGRAAGRRPSRQAMIYVASLIAAFVAGYIAGLLR
jgi:anti-sigma-K factor RskA